jgi:UDP-N-acetylmuramoyl-L-alanyl-D-glutamate--2,6-diaminopimelate ligase
VVPRSRRSYPPGHAQRPPSEVRVPVPFRAACAALGRLCSGEMTLELAPLRERRPRPDLPEGPYLIAGIGRAGMAAASALEPLVGPAGITAWDGVVSPGTVRARAALTARGIQTELGGDGVEPLSRDPRPSCVVKSPGIPFDSPLVVAAAHHGLPVIDELELGWRLGRAPLVAGTGTNGKSTTAALMLAILRSAGMEVALTGNVEDAPPLSVAPRDVSCLVCEVSSYQLEGCPEFLPEVAVFTNLTRDHLHRHHTMERYGELKRRLFVRGDRTPALAVVNVDQAYGRALTDAVDGTGGRVVRFGVRREAECRIESCDWDRVSGIAQIRSPRGVLELRSSLPGPHNAANVAAAVALGEALGMERETLIEAVADAKPVPGRFEPIDAGQPFDVLVDFAHTPDALRQVMLTARRIVSRRSGGRLHTVLSAPGIHDPPKRPEMGLIARSLADELVITTGSLFGEAAEAIVDDVMRGVRAATGAEVTVMFDRRSAIDRALRGASKGDLVLIAGRGALPRLRVDVSGAGAEFDDRVVVRELLAELHGRKNSTPANMEDPAPMV